MVVYGTFRDKPDEDYIAVFDGRKCFVVVTIARALFKICRKLCECARNCRRFATDGGSEASAVAAEELHELLGIDRSILI